MRPGTELCCPECDAVVYRARKEVRDGDVVRAADFEHTNGTPCRDYDAIRCTSCGAEPPLDQFVLRDPPDDPIATSPRPVSRTT